MRGGTETRRKVLEELKELFGPAFGPAVEAYGRSLAERLCEEEGYIAEAIAWSENGNHATIYTMGLTAQEADAKLIGALRELKLVPETSMKGER